MIGKFPCRRLAVGTGYSDEFRVECQSVFLCQFDHGLVAIVNSHHRDTPGDFIDSGIVVFHHEAARPAIDGLRDILMTVVLLAANSDKQLARFDRARIDRHTGESARGIRVTEELAVGHSCQLFEAQTNQIPSLLLLYPMLARTALVSAASSNGCLTPLIS